MSDQEQPAGRGHMLSEKATFHHAPILTAQVETNVPQGGDAGHGGRTTLLLKDEGSFAFGAVNVTDSYGEPEQIEIQVLGDAEAEVLANALMWAGERLHALIGTSPGSVAAQSDDENR